MIHTTLGNIKQHKLSESNTSVSFAVRSIFFVLFICFLSTHLNAQFTVPNYSSCPNQIVTVTATWNNIGSTSYTLIPPPGGQPASSTVSASGTFTISHPGPGNVTYSVLGVGSGINGAVSFSLTFVLNVIVSAPLVIPTPTYYCVGQMATITVPPQSNATYSLSGTTWNLGNLSSNIIVFGPLTAQNSGTYTVISIGSCTYTGTQVISMAPNTPLSINGASNVCQGNNVTLQSALLTGVNFQWFDPQNQLFYSSGSSPSGTTLVGVVPVQAGLYTATADLPWGPIFCERKATIQVDVVATTPVNVSASPTSTLCQGDKLSFSALAGNAIGWSWAGPQSFQASISNPTINPVTPSNQGTYTVTALFTNNVITCQTSVSIPVGVVAVNQPLITMPNSVCEGANASFSAFAQGANSYSWQGPNQFSPVASSTVITNVLPSASGIYYVTAGFSQNTTSCSSTSSAQLNVVPVNAITIIPTAPVCVPQNANLQCSAIGANQYNWVGPNNFVATGANPTVFYPQPNASGIYTVTAFFSGGNITCTNVAYTQLVVNPILNFSLVPRQQVCYNTQLDVTGPSGATSYTWTASNGFNANTKDISFASVQPANSGNYTLQINYGPCITSAGTTIDVLTPIQFSLTPQARELCSGDTTVFEVGAIGGTQNYAYLWNPTVFFDNPVGSKKIAVPKSSIIYNVVAHDIACPNYTIGYSFPVTVNQAPVPNLQLERTYGCVPFVMTYDTKLDGISPITTYDFGGLKKLQGNRLTNFSLDVPGTYSLTIYTTAKTTGCKGIYHYPSPLIVYPKPGANITWSPEYPTTTDEVIFSSSIANGEVVSRFWAFSGGLPAVIDTSIDFTVPGSDTSNAINPVRRYEKFGKYPVMLVIKNEKECMDSIVRFMTVIDDFKLYIPNTFTPNGDGVNDVFNVKGTGMRTDGFSMQITDRWGITVFSTKDVAEGWDGKYGGKVVPNGTFFYKVKAVGQNGEGRREFSGYVTVLN
jgi:gliding motility-associated-like protein